MTRIYLIRHAEAEGNLYRRAQGNWDGKITELGKKQIDVLEDRFRDISIDAVYSSDLSRAMETAGAFTRGRGLVLVTNPLLREMRLGEWEGQAWGDIAWKYPGQMEYFSHDPAKLTVPGSESFYNLQQRIKKAVLQIAADHDGQTVAIVSHGMAIRAFLCDVLGFESSGIDAVLHGDNTNVSLLEVEKNEVKVLFYNDNSHLSEGLSSFARQKWWRKGAAADNANLRYVPMNLNDKAEAELYLKCYEDSWKGAHGSSQGFVPSIYIKYARAHSKLSPETVVKVMSGDNFAGIIELDPERGKREKHGWISLLYLAQEYRGKGFGVQLLGYCAAFFFLKNRDAIRLHVAVTNEQAITFYKRNGFYEIGVDPGVSSAQLLLEKII